MRFGSSFHERSNSGSHGLGEHDEFMPNDSVFSTSTTSTAAFAGANTSALPSNSLQRQIISMEDDEFADDQDSISGMHLNLWEQKKKKKRFQRKLFSTKMCFANLFSR